MLTEEELKSLVEQVTGGVMNSVNVALNGYDKKLKLRLETIESQVNSKTEEETVKEEVKSDNSEVLSIKKQLEAMKLELDKKTQQEKEASLRSELSTLLSQTISPSVLTNTLLSQLGSKFNRTSNNEWLDNEGNTLKGEVDKFLTSDEGKVFIKPTISNVSTSKTGTPNPPKAPNSDKSDQIIEDLFLG
jgi:predicted RNase H-like nuclease (RuvC/YqgF family)